MGLPKSDTSPSRANLSLKEGDGENVDSFRTKKPHLREVNRESETGHVHSKLHSKRSNHFFYKVSNHQELFKIGQSFFEDHLSGIKSFAITSTGYQTSQQKTILGLASFFDHKEEDFKIAIVSDNLEQGALGDIVSICKPMPMEVLEANHGLHIKSFYNHFDFIDLNEVIDISRDDNLGEFDTIFDHIVDDYDIIFWDVPELHKIQLNSETYFPMIMKFESLSIIVSKQISKQSDVDDLKQFFLSYGINMKGLLFDDKNDLNELGKQPIINKNKAVKKKYWWQRIFG